MIHHSILILETQYTWTRVSDYTHTKKCTEPVLLPQHILIFSIIKKKKQKHKTPKVFTCLPNHAATNSLKNRDWERTVPILINILCITESKKACSGKMSNIYRFHKVKSFCRLNFLKRRLSLLSMRWGADRFSWKVCPFVPIKLWTRWVHCPFES